MQQFVQATGPRRATAGRSRRAMNGPAQIRQTVISRLTAPEKCVGVLHRYALDRSVPGMSIHSPGDDPSGRVRRVRHITRESCRPVLRSTMMVLGMIAGSDAVRNLR